MYRNPDTAAMLGAVATFLRDVCAPALTGRDAFMAKVAANAVEIAARESRDGPLAAAAELATLQTLLETSETDLDTLRRVLCDQIISGGRDETDPALINALVSIVASRVRIEQPGYASLRRTS
jgi:hypothetical protein